MRKTALIAAVFAGILSAVSCKKASSEESFGKPETISEATTEIQKPEDLGKNIFEGKGTCIACHQPDAKLIGPSLQDIAKIYKEKNGDMVGFLKAKAEPIVDPTQYALMQSSLEMTKTYSEEELKALEAYVYSYLK